MTKLKWHEHCIWFHCSRKSAYAWQCFGFFFRKVETILTTLWLFSLPKCGYKSFSSYLNELENALYIMTLIILQISFCNELSQTLILICYYSLSIESWSSVVYIHISNTIVLDVRRYIEKISNHILIRHRAFKEFI